MRYTSNLTDSGKCSDGVLDAPNKSVSVGRVGRCREVYGHGQESFGFEPGIDLTQLQPALGQESRPGYQEKAQANLTRDCDFLPSHLIKSQRGPS